MPTVTPSDGAYQSYQRSVGELEDEFKSELKRREKTSAERLRSLEEKHRSSLESRSDDHARELERVKEGANEAISKERELARSEVERIKAATYDKFGRYQGNDADMTKRQLEDQVAMSEAQRRQDRAALATEESRSARRAEEIEREAAEKTEKAVTATRDAANQTYSKYSEEQNNQYSELDRQNREKYDRLARRMTEDVQLERKKAADAVKDIKADSENRFRKNNESEAIRFSKAEDSFRKRSDEDARSIANSHEAETRELRQQVRDATASQGDYARGKAQGSADAIREHESEQLARERNLVDAYETQLQQQKIGGDVSQEGRSEKMRQALREQGESNAHLIRKQVGEAHATERDLNDQFQSFRKEVMSQSEKDKRMAEERSVQQAELASQRSAEALTRQAETTNRTLSDQQRAALDTQRILEAKLQEHRTSDDIKLVSPAAEEKIRRALVNDYDKIANAERERNARARDHIATSANERLHEESDQHAYKMAHLAASGTQDRNLERNQLMSTIEEVEHNRTTTLRDQDATFAKQSESRERNFGSSLEQQRRQYETMLEQTRNDASTKLATMRQEHEFEDKMGKRAFAARENTLTREYEKRLAEEKANHDAVLNDVRTKADLAVRDAEKKSKSMVEEVSRGYEQRIAELQFQQKERERFLAESHQDEIDRMKRANALLSQKKS